MTADDNYRIMIKLKSLLNTNGGSMPSIIKAIKFIYSSEVVHIVPDYPAGLIINHDGEGTPGLNFNKLFAEIIPAGVSFSTKEIFAFIDAAAAASDDLETAVRRDAAEGVEIRDALAAAKGEGAGASDAADMAEGFAAGRRFHRKYDGAYKHDGGISYNGNILAPI